MATSTIRRKPMHTYKSPSASTPADQLTQIPSRPLAKQPTPTSSTRASSQSSSTSGETKETRIVVPLSRGVAQGRIRKGPPLPLYHPLGPLALSLPELDPALFGLPNRITVDDAADEPQDPNRRSSSRTRRPAAKVRDRQREGAPDDGERLATLAASANAQSPEAAPKERTASPRKRRAAGGSGSGGGAKRKRKAETDDADGIFPPPAKRTRNPRGTGNTTPMVRSPLVSEAVAAPIEEIVEADTTSVPDSVGASGEAEAEEMPAELPPAPEPKRTSRSRKSRASTNKRRNSSASASTNTSASVSIAANTRNTRSAKARALDSASDRTSNGNVEKKDDEEAENASSSDDKKDGVPKAPVDKPGAHESEKAEAEKDEKMDVDVPPAQSEVSPASPPQTEKEEKEDGELSDEPQENTPAAKK